MPQQLFAIDVPDGADLSALRMRIVTAFTAVYGYRATVPDPNGSGPIGQRLLVPNPETAAQFTRRKLREHIKEVVAQYEAEQAGESARAAAQTKAQNEVTLQ